MKTVLWDCRVFSDWTFAPAKLNTFCHNANWFPLGLKAAHLSFIPPFHFYICALPVIAFLLSPSDSSVSLIFSVTLQPVSSIPRPALDSVSLYKPSIFFMLGQQICAHLAYFSFFFLNKTWWWRCDLQMSREHRSDAYSLVLWSFQMQPRYFFFFPFPCRSNMLHYFSLIKKKCTFDSEWLRSSLLIFEALCWFNNCPLLSVWYSVAAFENDSIFQISFRQLCSAPNST